MQLRLAYLSTSAPATRASTPMTKLKTIVIATKMRARRVHFARCPASASASAFAAADPLATACCGARSSGYESQRHRGIIREFLCIRSMHKKWYCECGAGLSSDQPNKIQQLVSSISSVHRRL